MAGFELDTGVLSLVQQLSERQAEHVRAILDYVEANTALSDVGGVVMACLGPRYAEGRSTAQEGLRQAVTVCDAVAARAEESRQAYLDADRATVDRLRALAGELGITFPEFSEPAAPTLGTGAAGGAAVRTWDLDEGLTAWGRATPEDLRPAVDGARTLAVKSVNYAHAVESSPINNFALRYPADQGAKWVERKVWNWLDGEVSPTTATSTLRERYELKLSRFHAQAYAAGTHLTPGGSLTQYTDWAQDRTTERSLQGANQLYSTVTQARSAWNALETAQDAATRRDAVAGLADGTANTEQIDWAE